MADVKVSNLRRLEEKYVLKYEQEELEEGLIMFYGDSGFTRWKSSWGHRPLEEDIRMKDGSKAAINHGFGTSTAEEQLYFYDRLVRPWRPRALVLKTYGNDAGFNYSPEEILFLQSRIIEYARHDMPGIRFYLCDVTPAPNRMNLPSASYNQIMEYNRLLKEYCERHDDCTFVCHTESPLFYNDASDAGSYDTIRTDMYVEDNSHFNQKGYDKYQEFFLKVLDDIL